MRPLALLLIACSGSANPEVGEQALDYVRKLQGVVAASSCETVERNVRAFEEAEGSASDALREHSEELARLVRDERWRHHQEMVERMADIVEKGLKCDVEGLAPMQGKGVATTRGANKAGSYRLLRIEPNMTEHFDGYSLGVLVELAVDKPLPSTGWLDLVASCGGLYDRDRLFFHHDGAPGTIRRDVGQLFRVDELPTPHETCELHFQWSEGDAMGVTFCAKGNIVHPGECRS